MIEWRDQGVLLSVRRQGEADAVLDVFTRDHGRRSGFVRGGGSRRRAAELQPGADLDVVWRARLDDQLGRYQAEATRIRAAAVLDDADALAALQSTLSMLALFLPDGDPYPQLYARTCALLDALAEPRDWPTLYAAWEMDLLATLGFGLDLSACAATGGTQELVWVSPRSGRAVSRQAGAPYADRLLRLPPALALGDPLSAEDFADALALTAHFFERRVAPSLERPWPPSARARLRSAAERGQGRATGLKPE